MSRRFRSRTFVFRKKYIKIFLCAVIPVFIFSGRLPSVKINPQAMFADSVLCMAKLESEDDAMYQRLLEAGNIVFAYQPDKKTKSPGTELYPQDDISANPEDALAQETYLSIPSVGIEMRNQTSFLPDTDALEEIKSTYLPVEMNSDKPQVLIFHTHTTESFYGCDRTDDESMNVVAVGSVISDILNAGGVNTIHCKTVHDYDYNGSYSKSYATVETFLLENPSIKVVLDVHRDGITYEDGSGLRVISDINGKTAGQVMLVVGTDEGGLYHPGWESNLSLALKIQRRMNDKYPGLARPLNLRSERFNQNLSNGMMIVEIGGNGNALSEAIYGAELFADVLLDVISQ